MKVLISAYACEPHKGSEPGVGWNTIVELSKTCELWVITRANNRENIEKNKNIFKLKNINFIYVDLPKWLSFWKKGRRGVQLYYYLWQVYIYFIAKRLHTINNYDLIHHVTFVKYWSPSFLSLLPVPFIWGPVGGGESAPRTFWRNLGCKGYIYEFVRTITRWCFEQDPFVKYTARKSALCLATSNETATRLTKIGAKNVQIFSQVGLLSQELSDLKNENNNQSATLRVVSMGNLLPFKGYHLGLKAMSKVKDENIEYWIIGDGPERDKLEELAKELKIDDKVKFLGRLPRKEALCRLKQCHIFLHTCLHESGGNVCSEAMAASLPVVCLDSGGPGLQVIQGTGFKIKPSNPNQVIEDIATKISMLIKDRDLLNSMGLQARIRAVEEYNWGNKGDFYIEMYEEVINSCRDVNKK
ncbi:glycosyl transferase family 1 [Bacillus cereus]|uniref:glycosyltransferase family 4 protein n=1 Tax=Bacillus cereus TaxID=1396 RepID=UPI000BF97F3C|nr:glycosyltransferase [Bacillus cereus]PFR30839.1 glycosyl transferase family 1 [Bacillus cereus]